MNDNKTIHEVIRQCDCEIYCERSGIREATDNTGELRWWCPYIPEAKGARNEPRCKLLEKDNIISLRPIDK